jgi:hypothetical protein
MLSHWTAIMRFPDLVPITQDNFPYLANNKAGALLLVGFLDEKQRLSPARSQSAQLYSALQTVATRSNTVLEPLIRQQVLIGWLDAVKYASFLSQYGLQDKNTGIVVVDMATQRYWIIEDSVTSKGTDTYSAARVAGFIRDIITNVISPQRLGWLSMPQQLANMIGFIPTVVVCVVVGVGLVYLVWRLVFADLCRGEDFPSSSPVSSPLPSSPHSSSTPARSVSLPAKSKKSNTAVKQPRRPAVGDVQPDDEQELDEEDVDDFLAENQVVGDVIASSDDSEIEGLRKRNVAKKKASVRRLD